MSAQDKIAPRRTSAGTSQLQKPSGTKLQLPQTLNRPPSALTAPSRSSEDSISPSPSIPRPSSALRAPTNSSRILNTPTNQLTSSSTKPPVPKFVPSQPVSLQSILTPTGKNIQLQMRVLCLNKHKGKVSFIGRTSFAEGQWYGITLDDADGKNNGSVQGIQYFECEPNFGLFVRQHQILPLSNTGASPGTNPPSQNGVIQIQLQKTPASTRGISQLQQPSRATPTGERPPSVNASTPKLPYNIGDRVIVGGKKGIVRYIGRTQFAKGLWTGVELESPSGKNNGSIEGVKYFTCAPRHGLFSPASKVVVIPASLPTLNTPTQAQVKRRTPPSINSLNSTTSSKQASKQDRPNSRNSSSSMSSAGRSKRADSDMELEGQITGLINKLEEVNMEKAGLEDMLAGERNVREDLQFSLDEHAISLDVEGPRTPGILRETKQEVELLHGTIRKLQQQLATSFAQAHAFTGELEELRESLDRERKYIVQLEKEKENKGDILPTIEVSSSDQELERLCKEKKELQKSLSERDVSLQAKSADMVALEETIKQLKEDLSQQGSQLESLEKEYRDARQTFEKEKRNSLSEVDSVEQQKTLLQEELSSLKGELDFVKEELEEKDTNLVTLNTHLSSKESVIEDMKLKMDLATEEFHVEREDLQAPITELENKNSRLEDELARVKCDLRRSDSSASELDKYQLKCKELEESLKVSEEERSKAREAVMIKEEEYFRLQEKLSAALLLIKQREEENTQQRVMLKELEESNQRKNTRLALMEQSYLQNGEVTSREANEAIEDPLPQNFRLDDMDFGSTPDESLLDSPTNQWSQQTARLYCDICEKFDSHETEDCPIQNDNDLDDPDDFQTPKLVSYSERPYCDVCEVFGHETCDSQETF